MTQGERLRAIRKELNLTLEKFGDKLGVQRSAISKIELGDRSLTDQMIKSICREFNVSYDYLVDGTGDMFSDLPDTILDELCAQYELDDIDKKIIEIYLELPPEARQALKDKIREKFLTDDENQ
ncbi:MAG: helix-turn-helix domain-containing protein [Coprococcus sp.]|jgi:transcriptional regulator with XRE-family HTH domain